MNTEVINLKFNTKMIDLPITAKKLTQRYQFINRSPSTNIDSSLDIISVASSADIERLPAIPFKEQVELLYSQLYKYLSASSIKTFLLA